MHVTVECGPTHAGMDAEIPRPFVPAESMNVRKGSVTTPDHISCKMLHCLDMS